MLDYYVYLNENGFLIFQSNNPNSFNEPISCLESYRWLTAVKEESK